MEESRWELVVRSSGLKANVLTPNYQLLTLRCAIIKVVPLATSISESIKSSARELGFDLAGIAPVEQFRELEYFPEWIAAGHHGDMGYLESRTENGELKRSSIQVA